MKRVVECAAALAVLVSLFLGACALEVTDPKAYDLAWLKLTRGSAVTWVHTNMTDKNAPSLAPGDYQLALVVGTGSGAEPESAAIMAPVKWGVVCGGPKCPSAKDATLTVPDSVASAFQVTGDHAALKARFWVQGQGTSAR